MKPYSAYIVVGALMGTTAILSVPALAQGTSGPGTSCPQRFSDPEPRGQAGWITADDYPQRALREERQGKVRFRVNVTVAGRAENVEILESGDSDLAAATMKVLTRRARFKPAVRDCQPVPGEYEGALTWILPE